MHGITRIILFAGQTLKHATLEKLCGKDLAFTPHIFRHFEYCSSTVEHRGLENTTIAEVLKSKGEEKDGSLLWCRTNDTVYDAVRKMAEHNVGSLVVVKLGEPKLIAGIVTERGNRGPPEGCTIDTPRIISSVGSLVVVKLGEPKLIAGIVTERDYLRKIIVQGRSSKSTRVGEIMTEENNLITVTSDTNVLQAMQMMTDKHIRHVPVVDGKMVGMISIVDVVRAVVEQQSEEVKRLNEFIKGDYY